MSSIFRHVAASQFTSSVFPSSLFTYLFILLSIFIGGAPTANAADISIDLSVQAKEDIVEVTVRNTGRDPALYVSATISFLGQTLTHNIVESLGPEQRAATSFYVSFPKQLGSYPLLTSILYHNDGRKLAALDAGYFNFRTEHVLETGCPISEVNLARSATVTLPPSAYGKSYLFLPPEIFSGVSGSDSETKSYQLTDTSSLRSNYAAFSIHEATLPNGERATKICPFRLITHGLTNTPLKIPPVAYATIACIGFIVAFLLTTSGSPATFSPNRVATIRWAFSIFVISTLFFIYFTSYNVSLALATDIPPPKEGIGRLGIFFVNGARSLLNWLYFSGTNYDNFTRYAADPLFIYMLSGNWFVLRFLIKPDPSNDKYWHLMLSFFSLLPFRRNHSHEQRDGKVFFWNTLSKVAALALCVKIFYLPVFISWTINNIFHGLYKYQTFHWNFSFINQSIVSLLIFIDVLVFTASYLVELPMLKNQIRSVEATLMGWFVCIICYPPLNEFAMVLVDIPLTSIIATDIHSMFKTTLGSYMNVAQVAAEVVITLLWAVYVWATLALGWKASNLTNRGIVARGPYRFVRHPAYISKVTVWLVTSTILGTMNFSLVISLAIIYSLRAWTEERHLLKGGEYESYKSSVPWRAIPRVF